MEFNFPSLVRHRSHCASFPMKQMTFADADYAGKPKQTRKGLFLIAMNQMVPWKGATST